MNPRRNRVLERPWARQIPWDIVLAAIFSAFLFAILNLAIGGVLISLVTAVVVLAVFGLFHYLFWGQALLKDVAQEREKAEARARQERDRAKPADEFTLVLNEPERVELIHALESLAETPVAVDATQRPIGQREAIRGVLDRLRGFGA